MNLNVCAVIVSYNDPEKLDVCINSALSQADQVVVVDNASEKKHKHKIKRLSSKECVALLCNDENKGLGFAFNQGIQYSLAKGYRWTLLLDQDSKLGDKMIQGMLRSYDRLDEMEKRIVALLVPRILDINFRSEIKPVITSNLFNKKISGSAKDVYIHFQISSGTLIKNEITSEVGLMNEQLFVDYIDFDYCFRVLNKGFKILQVKSVCLYHSLGEMRKLFFFTFREHCAERVYYQTRNRLIIIRAYGCIYKSVGYSELIRLGLKLPKIVFFESKKLKKLECYMKGIVDGVRNYKKIFTVI